LPPALDDDLLSDGGPHCPRRKPEKASLPQILLLPVYTARVVLGAILTLIATKKKKTDILRVTSLHG
jgi:hypothetical protein